LEDVSTGNLIYFRIILNRITELQDKNQNMISHQGAKNTKAFQVKTSQRRDGEKQSRSKPFFMTLKPEKILS